ncbi:bifunctional RNase H/acid phosphatase [Streptomyces sp. A012304]|uniref:bifunctional RNase H/acid phosphatase n=1 Tax=Streptomyces sp. A012304 TaxID=375446 RepID=UPI00222E23B1|nr:bifunctional RNase H/acid phosphatase [Streptomyces sp. A012304]GKQ34133.1 bifunctional RNase H/acid phosphatase [Streptomyces sp. A012304]
MREFIVEADGGSRGNPGPAGYGSVVIDAATGETLVERAEYIGVATNNVAEYRGLLAGLRAAHELDPSAAVRVRMDSKLVVEQMTGRWKIKHPAMKPLAAEAARVFPPGQVSYEWIPREQNKHADRLANEAMDAGKRGEQWDAGASRAALEASSGVAAAPERPGRAASAAAEPSGRAASAVPEPSGPPGDAVAGAAKAREALGRRRASATDHASPASPASLASPASPGAKADDDQRAARTVATPPAEQPSVGWSSAPDLGAPATFVLLRHGETPLTPEKRFSGSGGTDPSLSAVGREQAERVAAALARRGTIQHIVASPLARTRETAGAVAARLGLEVTVDDGLRETDFGAWEGLTFGEVRERHPEDLDAWLADPEAEPTGGGESFAATATRIAATRDKLVAAYAGRTVLLVTHVTPIKTLVRLALGAPPESLFRMELSAASLSVVAYYADGNASVRLLNDTSHLRP